MGLVCVCVTSIWCVYFDITYPIIDDYFDVTENLCLNTSKVDNYVLTNEALSYLSDSQRVESILSNMSDDWYVNVIGQSDSSFEQGFGTNLTASQRFLLELLISHLMTLFVYSPLIALLYPVLYNYFQFVRNPDKMTEGKFFSDNQGFDDVTTILDKDQVDASGKTIRFGSIDAIYQGDANHNMEEQNGSENPNTNENDKNVDKNMIEMLENVFATNEADPHKEETNSDSNHV